MVAEAAALKEDGMMTGSSGEGRNNDKEPAVKKDPEEKATEPGDAEQRAFLLACSEDESVGAAKFAESILRTAGAHSLEQLKELLKTNGNPLDALRIALAGVAESAAHLHHQKKERTRVRHEDKIIAERDETKKANEDALASRARAEGAERAAREKEARAEEQTRMAHEDILASRLRTEAAERAAHDKLMLAEEATKAANEDAEACRRRAEDVERAASDKEKSTAEALKKALLALTNTE